MKTIAVSEIENECSDSISELIEFIIDDYDLNVISITTDNAPNIIKSIKDLCIPNIRCMNHSLQLSINNAIEKGGDIEETINLFISLSKQLRTVVNKHRLGITIGTITSTRWNSLFLLLNKIEESKNELVEYYEENNRLYKEQLRKYKAGLKLGIINGIKPKVNELLKYIPAESSIEYEILDNLISILKPMYELTIKLESRDTTMGMAILLMKKIIYEFDITSYSPKVNEFAEKIRNDLIKRLEIIESESTVPLLCCILDVRVKAFIKGHLVGFTDIEYQKAKNALLELVSDNCFEEENDSICSYEDGLDKYLPSKKRKVVRKKEVDLYLEFDEIFTTNENISNIWLSIKASFPQIYEISKQYLSCQPTSSEVERVFSECGRISNLLRSNITSENLENKILISRNK